jgi:transposase-like protein
MECRPGAVMINAGIRKIARFTGASPAGVLRWIRKEHATI